MLQPIFLSDLPPRIKDEFLTEARNRTEKRAREWGDTPEQVKEFVDQIMLDLQHKDIRVYLEEFYGFNPLESPEC